MALDVQSRGVKFDSELFQFHVLMLDILFTHMAVTGPWFCGFDADHLLLFVGICAKEPRKTSLPVRQTLIVGRQSWPREISV